MKRSVMSCILRLVRRFRRNPDKNQVPPIETHGCAKFWFNHGCPKKVGSKIIVEMKSGKRAVFRLSEVRRNWDVDWDWYTFKFVYYLTNKPISKTATH